MNKMINYPHLASMVFGQPLMITPHMLASIKSILMPRMIDGEIKILGDQIANIDAEVYEPKDRVELAVSGGVAVIPVHGVLSPRRDAFLEACYGMTSYEKLSSQLDVALADDSVKHIVLDLNSPGGAVTGAFEFADKLYAARSEKPITAIVNYAAYSAGYLIASAASERIVSITSGTGSIGVIAETVEYSKLEDAMGVKFTTVYKGDRKNDLSVHEPITDQALAFLNEIVSESYDLFVDAVARNLDVKVQSIIDTQAAVYRGSGGIDVGLATKLQTPADAINEIAAKYDTPGKPKASRKRTKLRAAATAVQNRL